jgi:RHS repeat-associated protein
VKQDISISYIHGDHLGSTSKTTGASASTQTYYPYGAIKTSSGTPPTDYGYTGQKRDASANLVYYGARYYDPALARFIQPDTIVPNPMDPQSLNRYSYVRNNPVNRIDPTGHEDCAAEDDWCWENRWYEAHGQCWSDAKQDWSKSCQPEFQDEDILSEVLGEEGGLAVAQRADMLKLFAMLLQSIAQQASNIPPPNLFIIGLQLSGSLTPAYGELFAHIVFDFQHLEIGYFVGGGYAGGGSLGGKYGALGTLFSGTVAAQFGIGWCLPPLCQGVSNYAEWFSEGGGSVGMVGFSYASSTVNNQPNYSVQVLMFSIGYGTATATAYYGATYAAPVAIMQYENPTAFALGVQLSSSFGGANLSTSIISYGFGGYPYLCSIASNKSTCNSVARSQNFEDRHIRGRYA